MELIDDESNKIYIFGAENRLYVHHKLFKMNLKDDFENIDAKNF